MKIPRADGRLIVAGALVFGTIGAVVLVLTILWQALDRQAQDYQTLRSDYQTLYSEAIQAGAKPEAPSPEDVPVVDPKEPLAPVATPEPGPTGPQGPGPTRDQVRAAVREMFATGEFDGADGRPPTDAELDAAVERYCADGACDGEDGSNGVDGVDGLNGADGADGAPGRGPTDEELDSAVNRYCAAQPGGSCAGEDGKDGTDGADGTDGTDGKDGKFVAGDYTCPDETPYMRGFSVQENGDWSVTCGAFPPSILP